MRLRFEFKMLFGKSVPADLDWGVIGEWSAGVDYQNMARNIYASLCGHYPLQSVAIFKGYERIACWSHFEKTRHCEQETIQRTLDQALARFRDS